MVKQADLDRWLAFAHNAARLASGITALLNQGNTGSAKSNAIELRRAASVICCDMERAGAQRPDAMLPRPEIPIEKLDTPANRRLLDALRHVEDVEADRMTELGLTMGNVAITTYRQMVELEIFGPKGRVAE